MNVNQQFQINNLKELKRFYNEYGFEFLFTLQEECRSFNREKHQWLFKIDEGYVLGEYQEEMEIIINPQKDEL